MTHAWQKRKKQAEGTVVEAEAETPAELLSSRPAWVVDHNLASLWMKGLSEDMIPEELRLSPTEMAKLERLREWAADKAEETAQAPALPLQALTVTVLHHTFYGFAITFMVVKKSLVWLILDPPTVPLQSSGKVMEMGERSPSHRWSVRLPTACCECSFGTHIWGVYG